jgi:Glycerate kinase
MILNALKAGCRKFILGLGGSATNDAGIGALNALGVDFLDKDLNRLEPIGESLNKIEYIDDANLAVQLKESIFTIACDVKNPLYGDNGAAYVFAPQKGATEEDTKILDEGLKHYSKCTL